MPQAVRADCKAGEANLFFLVAVAGSEPGRASQANPVKAEVDRSSAVMAIMENGTLHIEPQKVTHHTKKHGSLSLNKKLKAAHIYLEPQKHWTDREDFKEAIRQSSPKGDYRPTYERWRDRTQQCSDSHTGACKPEPG